MAQKCKHPVRALHVAPHTWTDHHPYGQDTYTDYVLRCAGCKGEVAVTDSDRVSEEQYTKLTGRCISVAEAANIFKQNNDLFHRLTGLHGEIVNMVMSNPRLEKRIAAKRKVIDKHKKELAKLITQYNGGKEPFLP